MTTSNYYNQTEWLSVQEAAGWIIAAALAEEPVVFALIGEPGIAKTAMLNVVCDVLKRRKIYVDVPTLEISDLMVPALNHETKTTSYYPNETWGFHLDDPAVICYDEFSKGPGPVVNTLHPSLTIVNGARRIGSTNLPENSVIFITGNLNSDGVGDVLKGHTQSRVVPLYVRKPYREEFVRVAKSLGFHPVMIAWLEREEMNPFASYTDPDFDSYVPEQKEMVYWPSAKNPARNQAYGCPRSYETASRILWTAEKVKGTQWERSHKELSAALTGAVGRVCASKILAFKEYASELPSAVEILNNPQTAKLPSSPASQIMAATSALNWIPGSGAGLAAPKTRVEVIQRFDAGFAYLQRMGVEVQAYFVNSVKHAAEDADRNNTTATSMLAKLWAVMTTTETFKTWAMTKSYVY